MDFFLHINRVNGEFGNYQFPLPWTAHMFWFASSKSCQKDITKMSIDIKSFSNGNSMVGQHCKTDLYFLWSLIMTTNKGQRYTANIPIQNKFKVNPSVRASVMFWMLSLHSFLHSVLSNLLHVHVISKDSKVFSYHLTIILNYKYPNKCVYYFFITALFMIFFKFPSVKSS